MFLKNRDTKKTKIWNGTKEQNHTDIAVGGF